MISRFSSWNLKIALLVFLCALDSVSGPAAFAGQGEQAAKGTTIPDGTPIHLYLMDDLSSKKAKDGDAIRFKVREAIRVDDVEVVPVDSPVVGHVAAVGRSGFAGHSGKLGLLLDYVVAVDGTKIPLRGEATVKGGSNGGVAAAATAVYGLPALLIRGWEADIHKGTMLNAYVNGDHTVALGRAR